MLNKITKAKKVNDLLNDVNTKFDEIKEKLNSILGNSSDTNSQ